MDKIVIQGGRRLTGRVEVSGSKNAALPILLATLLHDGVTTLHRVPKLWDVGTTRKLLVQLGAEVAMEREGARVDASTVKDCKAAYELVRTMRASVLVLGPLLARFGEAQVSLPGGCAIGSRPVDQHIEGLKRLGAHIEIEHGYIRAKAKKLIGGEYRFAMPTVGGVEQLMMAATLAQGTTVLQNCAREPEIVDLGDFLNAMGAKVSGQGTRTIAIEGVTSLRDAEYTVIPDRIEAGTLMVAAAITRGEVTVGSVVREHLQPITSILREAGVSIEWEQRDTAAHVRMTDRPRPTQIVTAPHPGFPTDMQAQLMALLAVADGESFIHERIFENRFQHILELRRLGADIDIDASGRTAHVRGVERLSGAGVMATDLRASASLVLAGLVAANTTEVHRVYHLDRGYERLDEKLASLGAHIHREKE